MKDVVNARFSAISSELQEQDVSAMPKERLLATLDKDARKYDLKGSSPNLGYMADFVLLTEKVKKYPWDDCAKFLAERGEILRRIEAAKGALEGRVADFEPRYFKTLKSRVIKKEDVENGFAEDKYSGYPSVVYGGEPFRIAADVALNDARNRFSGGRVDPLLAPPARQRFANGEIFLSFGPAVVLPGSVTAFQSMPQINMRCTRLLLTPDVAPNFSIHDLRVGRDSLMSGNAIPGAAFSEYAVGIGFALDVSVGLAITLMVENTCGVACMFSAMLHGLTR